MIKMKIGDWIIIVLSLTLIPISWSMTERQPGITSAIEINVADRHNKTFSVLENRKIKIAGELGDSIIEIKDGKVRFLQSPCSRKTCVLSGWHTHSGDQLVCLPNKVSISLLSQQDRFDGINF